jgi:glycosyltransferase involved in cell wall biosynthesis
VGRISQKFKNIDFLIKNYLQIKEKYNNVSLTLVGKLYDEDFLSKYEKELTS